jgi:hypothetical protein
MLFFAAQPLNPAGVSRVTFKAGSTTLGTDSTPADGFKVFLNAKTFPAGPLQLTATASGPCGQLTKTVTVNNVLNPPSKDTVGSQGACSPVKSAASSPFHRVECPMEPPLL